MPRRILHAKVEQKLIVLKKWIVYSTNREHCFKDEIARGYFGSGHICGCHACDPQMVLPLPHFEEPFVVRVPKHEG